MSEPQERYYNIGKLNKIFGITSLALLATVGWMLLDDYARGWKGHQREFVSYEVERTRVKYDKEENLLEEEERYQELSAQREAAQAAYDANSAGLADLEQALEQAHAGNEIVQQQYRFTKAELDTAKYLYEDAINHHPKDLDLAAKTLQALESLKAQERDLNLKVEKSDLEVQQQEEALNALRGNLDDIEKELRRLAQEKTVLENKLHKIDPHEMSLPNLFADLVRNLPLVDMASPSYKIEQVVLKDLKDDINFMQVPKVERCMTCHLGISNPDYQHLPQPYRSHPNLDQYVDKDSPHPMEDFGCTSCHGGRGRGTDFITAAHTPSSEAQAKEWEEKYNWEPYHHWDRPMVPLQYTESGCFKCHSGQAVIPGAERLNLGMALVERAGCYSCHEIDKYEGWTQPGPNLKTLATKVEPEWTYRWIADPQSFRHNSWMPAFWGQSNNSDPNSQARADQEVHSIARYLFAKSETLELTEIPVAGDAGRGEGLVASLGCMACHKIEPDPLEDPATRINLNREAGPNLIGLGSKTTAKWIFNWLKDPHRFRADTRMPNLRLTDQEAADIASYLIQSKNEAFDQRAVPQVDEAIVDDIVMEFLTRTRTQTQAEADRDAMSVNDKLVYAGEKLISHYGCFSCHAVDGFDGIKPIGTELTFEGSKSVHNLDFGFIHIEHSRQAWFKQKLLEPRIFDQNRVKTPGEKLRMPNFQFTEEEADALVTALLSFTKEEPGHLKVKGASVEDQYIASGQRIVRQYNCQGCHIIEGEGGAIQPQVIDWLVKYQTRERNEAEAVVASFSPPNLIGEGKKVHAQWLFDFLHAPSTIRPWLKTRMPTYNFTAAQSNALVRYFSALDKVDFPFAEMVSDAEIARDYADGHKLFSADYLDCAKCHIVGDQMPGGSEDNWAPDFALARERLKPQWMIDWLMDPQALLPGTKMPTYFDPQYFDDAGPDDILGGDEHKQIRALRNFLLGVGAEQGKAENAARIGDEDTAEQPTVGQPVSRAYTSPGG